MNAIVGCGTGILGTKKVNNDHRGIIKITEEVTSHNR